MDDDVYGIISRDSSEAKIINRGQWMVKKMEGKG
jgi:hypothetical protein